MPYKLKTYQYSDFTFQSNFDIPELFEVKDIENCDLSIIVHKDFPFINEGIEQNRLFHHDKINNRYIVYRKVFGHIIIYSNKVEYYPNQSKSDAFIRMVLLGTIAMILSNMKKLVSIHASCVKIGSKAVLFCANSGHGKSTTTFQFYKKGFEILSDDVTNINFIDGKMYAYPSVPRIKLIKEDVEQLNVNVTDLLQIPSTKEKYSYPIKHQFQMNRIEIDKIIFLDFESEVPEYKEVFGKEKLKLITKHLYRYHFAKKIKEFTHINPILFFLANQTKMFQFSRPKNENLIHETIQFLEDKLNS